MRRLRNAKIIATLGPASSSAESIQALFEAGADVFRFNFSHGTHADHQARYDFVRDVERKLGRPIAILADLQSPRPRSGQPALTEKDRRDLAFALELGVEWVALSFVERPEDLLEAREIIGNRAGLMTRIEKPSALEHLDEIVSLSDAVMVARGDLGVELPPERIPSEQRRILRACRQFGKPSVIATQMLESMISAPMPTRAEASDVAGAVYDGADAVMLSAESASGAYPMQAVSMMDRIISEVERDLLYRNMTDTQQEAPLPTRGDAICTVLRDVTRIVGAAATVTYTTSGYTSLRVARERPIAPILSITPRLATARRLALVWGVHSAVSDEVRNVDDMVGVALRLACEEGFAQSGDQIAITAGMPFGEPGTTNLLRIAEIE